MTLGKSGHGGALGGGSGVAANQGRGLGARRRGSYHPFSFSLKMYFPTVAPSHPQILYNSISSPSSFP